MNLQPETPPKFKEKQDIELKQATDSIVVVVTQCEKILGEAMGVQISVQNDPVVQKSCNELHIKEKQFVEIRMVAPTLVITQCLTRLHEGRIIKTEIEDLCHKEELLEARIKPWAKEALQLSQNLDNTLNSIQQMQRSIKLATDGPTTEKLVLLQGAIVQSLEMVHRLKSSITVLQTKMKEQMPH